ncbi:MAG: cation-translocating P-type ATPase [Bdellovibrionales bacterium]|nr:cation-translocating P-type ATPase [Bdellovibrionales bacterium]
MANEDSLVYFVSGMWCGTCAKTVETRVSSVPGVRAAGVNFPSKLLVVETAPGADAAEVDSRIEAAISDTGFAARKQAPGWVRTFQADLEAEQDRSLSNLRVAWVWFLAMWSSMIAFADYLGEGIGPAEAYRLSFASGIFGVLAISVGIVPYAKSGFRALRANGRLTLDLFIFLGGLSASVFTAMCLWTGRAVSYADSGAMIVAILLLAKKIEASLARRVSGTIVFEVNRRSAPVPTFRDGEWFEAEASQVRRGDRVRVAPGETVGFDGTLVSEVGSVNRHLVTGEDAAVGLKRGDAVLAGSIAGSPLELSVAEPLGHRKIDRWTEAALAAESRGHPYARLFAKIENGLTAGALVGALGIALLQWERGAGVRGTIESFFVGVLVFCPCLFASVLPLSKQMAHLAVFRLGAIMNRAEALFDLGELERVYLDKTGTLEAVESYFLGFDLETPAAFDGLLSALASGSRHPILAGLAPAPSSVRADPGAADFSAVEVVDVAGEGAVARSSAGDALYVGRPDFVVRRAGIPASALSGTEGYPVVAYGKRLMGRVVVKGAFDENSRAFLRSLLRVLPRAEIEILSGDPRLGAGSEFTSLDPARIRYFGNLTPEEKAARIGDRSLYVGDGLNDTLALARATVSCRVGQRILGLAPVDFEMRSPDLRAFLPVFLYARRFRSVLIQTGVLALVYNVVALGLAASGRFTPLGAAVAMLASFAVLLGSSLRLLAAGEAGT